MTGSGKKWIKLKEKPHTCGIQGLRVNDLPDDVICDIAIYADDTTLYSKCDQTSDLWQQLELAFELESNLQDTVDWGK